MKIAVFGTGEVGRRIATKLVEVGHDVKLGSRTADHAGATAWAEANSDRASNGTFADAAAFATMIFNCTKGAHSLAVVEAAGAGNLDGLSGNDEAAKTEVCTLLESFGWRTEEIIDLGDVTTARGTEMFLALWVRLYAATKDPTFNIGLVRPPQAS